MDERDRLTEADDAVQEAWIRLSRAGAGEIDNLEAWLVTAVGRVALTCSAHGTRCADRRLRRTDADSASAGACCGV